MKFGIEYKKILKELQSIGLANLGEILASVAQLDAYPTGDQEVVDSTPAGSATFFHGD